MKKLIAGLCLLLSFAVFAQYYDTARDIHQLEYNTDRIANELEQRNREQRMENIRREHEQRMQNFKAMVDDVEQYKAWFYQEIYRAVPDYRRIMNEPRFVNAIKRDNLTSAFDPISVSWIKVKLGKKHVKRPVYQKNSPNAAIKLLLDYKKYEMKVAKEAEQKRLAEQKEKSKTTGRISNDNIIRSQGFKNWLRNKPIYARIIRENKDAGEVNQVIDEYKSYAGLK